MARGPAAARTGTQRSNYGVGVVLVAGVSLRRTNRERKWTASRPTEGVQWHGTGSAPHLRCLDGRCKSIAAPNAYTQRGCDPSVMRWLVSLPVAKSTDLSLVDELHPWNVGVTMDWVGLF